MIRFVEPRFGGWTGIGSGLVSMERSRSTLPSRPADVFPTLGNSPTWKRPPRILPTVL
jgi:hypothetical protein